MALSANEELFLLENSYLKYTNYIKRKRSCDAHPIFKERLQYGEFHNLYEELKVDEVRFYEYFRMTPATFEYILHGIRNEIKKCSYKSLTISPTERLAVCLRFLSTGISYRSLAFSYRISHSMISLIVRDVCKAVWNTFAPIHMPTPKIMDLRRISNEFFNRWKFPNCIGCIDGKHIRIKAPAKSGSLYYNYKHYFSIVLQGVADANYRFICVETGAYGRQSDGGVFATSKLYKLLDNNEYNVLPPALLPGTDVVAPFVLLGDEAYPLKEYLLRPYRETNSEELLFNEMHSRTRKVIECAFGIIASKWRILTKPLETNVNTTKLITKTVCLLHNIIIDKEGIDKAHLLRVQENISQNVENSNHTGTALNRPTFAASSVRNIFKSYFVTNHSK